MNERTDRTTPAAGDCPSWCVADHDEMDDLTTLHMGEQARVITDDFRTVFVRPTLSVANPTARYATGRGPRVAVVGTTVEAYLSLTPRDAEGMAAIVAQLGHTDVADAIRAAVAVLAGGADAAEEKP